jgi:tetratricopeptide (TPR) repeat protein
MDLARSDLGEGHPGYAASLSNLAGVLSAMGDYAAALSLYQRAAEVFRAAQGEAHPHYAGSLNNLALVHSAMGDDAAALPLHRRAAEIRRAAMGDDAAALPLHRRAAEIRRAALGEAYPDYAFGLRRAPDRESRQPEDERGDFHQALQAFIERDYRRCVKAAFPMLRGRPSLEVLQLILISLLRSGAIRLADQIGEVAVDDHKERPWEKALLELTLGRIAPSDLRGLAKTDLQQCQALYYS